MSMFKQAAGATDGDPQAADSADAPWVNALMRHENTFLRLGAQVANWRLIAFFGLLIGAMGVGGMIYIGSKSKYIPVLVEVDKLGQTLAVRAVTGDDAITDKKRLVYREMFDLIENLRTVTTDRIANIDRLNKGYSRLSGAAYGYAKAEMKKSPPNEVGATKTIQVRVKTAIPGSGKSWQIDWEEHSFSLNGDEIGVENWRAKLEYELQPAGDVHSIATNPIGFKVPELSWQKVIL